MHVAERFEQRGQVGAARVPVTTGRQTCDTLGVPNRLREPQGFVMSDSWEVGTQCRVVVCCWQPRETLMQAEPGSLEYGYEQMVWQLLKHLQLR